MAIVILGASSGPGRLLFDALMQEGEAVTGIARQPRGIETGDTRARFISLDASDTDALARHISAEDTLIHCASPQLLTAYAIRNPQIKRLIALGSTRIYTRFPDEKCRRLTQMSHELWMRSLPTTLLHPTMIYGAPGLNNIERVVHMARVSPVIPLPENGRALIQPVHADDVVAAIRACLDDDETTGRTIVVPGNAPVSYRTFIELCIRFSGASCRVIPMPYFLLSLAAPLTRLIPGLPSITQDEIRRLLEDKRFETVDISQLLGRAPMDIRAGLESVIASLPKRT